MSSNRIVEPKSAAVGFIYAFTSPAHEKDLYKIGATTLQPMERARQLSASTAAPSPFCVAYSKHVAFPFQAEASMHRTLNTYRTHDAREFFRVPLHVVIAEFDRFEEVPVTPAIARREPVKEMKLPWSELFALFKDDGSPRELTAVERKLCADLAENLKSGDIVY